MMLKQLGWQVFVLSDVFVALALAMGGTALEMHL